MPQKVIKLSFTNAHNHIINLRFNFLNYHVFTLYNNKQYIRTRWLNTAVYQPQSYLLIAFST